MPKGIPKNGINSSWFKKGQKPWNFGLTGVTGGWNRGQTKETNESIRRTSEKLTGKRLSEDHRKKCGNGRRGKKNSRESNEKRRMTMLKRYEDPEYRKNHKDLMNKLDIKKKCAKPQWNRKQSKEEIEKRRQALIKHYKEHPETKEKTKHYGSDNGLWNNGSSFLPYPPEWTEKLKEEIRLRDGYICQQCGKTQEEELKEFGWKLPIHHVDYDKMNCSKKNLILLCTRCNIGANGNKDYWLKIYSKKIIQIYEKENCKV